jgi:hypothetical protein
LDGKLVSGSLSAPEGSEQDGSLPFFTYTERFYEQFPYYLSIGMTPDQYWNGDPALVKYYRKADELKLERKNQELWLQGMYIYEAICDASPLLHSFAKKGTKPHPYSEKPYPITNKQHNDEAVVKEKAVADKGKKFMEAFMKANNSRFKGNVQQ